MGREWIECLKKLVNGHEDFFPIPWLPWPPSSTGRGSRSRARRRHLAAVREVAERTWTSLNVTGATVHVHARSQQGPPCRLRNAGLDEGHKATWSLIIKEAQRVEHARRASFIEMPTGAELVRGLLKQCADLYGKTGQLERYVP